MQSILVPLDGSELAERALPTAEFLARAMKSSLVLVKGDEEWFVAAEPGQRQQAGSEAQQYLAEVSGRQSLSGLEVQTHVYADAPALAVSRAVAEYASDLIVMSTHGRGGLGRWAYGSVTEEVLRSARVPVLVVPAHYQGSWASGHGSTIIVGLDGSALAEDALPAALELAGALGATLTLIEVIEPLNVGLLGDSPYIPPEAVDIEGWLREAKTYLDDVMQRLRSKGVQVAVETTTGHPSATIARVASENDAAAIVVATHGRTGLARAFMGSVANGVLQRATVPVLVVHPPSLPFEKEPAIR